MSSLPDPITSVSPRASPVSIDQSRSAGEPGSLQNDLEVAFCTYRGQLDVVIELLERVVRYDIPVQRRRAIASTLLDVADDELRGATRRMPR